MTRTAGLLSVALAAVAACRPVPDAPVYEHPEDFDGSGDAKAEPIVGADPYELGKPRLSLGAFYEGGYSDLIAIDDVASHFYIFVLEGTATPTFAMSEERSVVEEGLRSNRIEHAGTPWWGGGIHWDAPHDLSAWKRVACSLRSDDPAYASLALHVRGGAEAKVELTSYGFVNDGAWHHVSIPTSAFQGVDWSKVTDPLTLVGGKGTSGAKLYLDNVYYAQD